MTLSWRWKKRGIRVINERMDENGAETPKKERVDKSN